MPWSRLSVPFSKMMFPSMRIFVPPCPISLFKFNGIAYDVYVFDPDAGGWNPSVPTVKIADAFFLDNPCFSFTWNRNFVVGP